MWRLGDSVIIMIKIVLLSNMCSLHMTRWCLGDSVIIVIVMLLL